MNTNTTGLKKTFVDIESFNFLILLIHSVETPITLFVKGAVEKCETTDTVLMKQKLCSLWENAVAKYVDMSSLQAVKNQMQRWLMWRLDWADSQGEVVCPWSSRVTLRSHLPLGKVPLLGLHPAAEEPGWMLPTRLHTPPHPVLAFLTSAKDHINSRQSNGKELLVTYLLNVPPFILKCSSSLNTALLHLSLYGSSVDGYLFLKVWSLEPSLNMKAFSSILSLHFKRKLWHEKEGTILNAPLKRWKLSTGARGHDFFVDFKLCCMWNRDIILDGSSWFLAKVSSGAFWWGSGCLSCFVNYLLQVWWLLTVIFPLCSGVSHCLSLHFSCGGRPFNSVKGSICPDFCQGCTMFST